MARIDPPRKRSPLTRLNWRLARREGGGTLPEPVTLMAHSPLLMHAYGGLELAFKRARRAPRNLTALAELKASALCGCEWCMDFGTWLARSESAVTEEQLRELPRFRASDAFSEEEKLVLEYAEGISRTPADVPEEVFARLRQRFDEGQLVELTWAAAIENMRARFNRGLGIGSQGYSDGGFCVRAETTAGAPDAAGPRPPEAELERSAS